MFRLITAQSAAFTEAKKKERKGNFHTAPNFPLFSSSCPPCMCPVPFSEQSLLEAPSSRLLPEGARQRGGKSIGEMRSAADLLAFVCARRRRAQEPSQQGAYSLPNPPGAPHLPITLHPHLLFPPSHLSSTPQCQKTARRQGDRRQGDRSRANNGRKLNR